MTAERAERLEELANRLQETDLSEQDRDTVNSIAHSSSTNYINNQVGSLLPMLQSMTDFLKSDTLDTLADPTLSAGECLNKIISVFDLDVLQRKHPLTTYT